MKHSMRLSPIPFSKIVNGTKTVELRLYDEKRQRIAIGDIISFSNTQTGDTCSVRVTFLRNYVSFSELFETLDLTLCGYSADEAENAAPTDMYEYYTRDEELEYGVVAIGIELIT